MHRRSFFQKAAIGALPITFSKLLGTLPPRLQDELIRLEEDLSRFTDDVTVDEDYWKIVRSAYQRKEGQIDLNNAGISPQALKVSHFLREENDRLNEIPSRYNMILERKREGVRKSLAMLINGSESQVALCRNTTEAMETAIFGIPLNEGDEVIIGKYDYPNMVFAWRQRAERDGIKLKWVDNGMGIRDKSELIDRYVKVKSSRTRAIHLTDIVNFNGLNTPVKEILEHFEGDHIWRLVDGAQSVGQQNVDVKSMNCTHFAASLHKWIGAPIGTGLLHVSKKSVASTYPLYGAPPGKRSDIRKFESLGTRSFSNELGILHALAFQSMIGGERKYKRLIYLRNYWISQLCKIDGFEILSPQQDQLISAIGLFRLKDTSAHSVIRSLWRNYKIHCTPIDWEGLKGIRVSANIYTLTSHLDRFVSALKEIAKSG
jgi:selenocysteine lyase/cysteine desulfurase